METDTAAAELAPVAAALAIAAAAAAHPAVAAAQQPSPQQQLREQLTPAELAARGEAPVKAGYLRTAAARVHVGAVTRARLGGGAADASTAAGQQAAEWAVAAAGEGERQRDVRQKSRKQAKKDRAQQKFGTAELCTMFALGKCPFASCRFNHDVESYLRTKPAELPGRCPFSAADQCPYGITCCYASTHTESDALSHRYIIGKQQQPVSAATAAAAPDAPPGEAAPAAAANGARQEAVGAGAAAAAAGAADPAAGGAAGLASEGAAEVGAALQPASGEVQQGQQQAQWWWRRDGSIPSHTVELPVSAAAPVEAINGMQKDLQQLLRKGQYDYSAADAVLESMGIHHHRQQQQQQWGRGGGRGGGRGRGGRGGRGGGRGPPAAEAAASGAAAGGPAPAADAPAAKRQKLEPGAAAAEPAAEAVVAAPAVAPAAGGDAAFLGSLGSPAAPDAAAATAAGAPAAPEAAAAAEGGGGSYVEAAPHPREKQRIDFNGKLFLAPLTTVGNLPFRRLCKGLGADVTCGEMALATNLLQGQPSEWALLKRHKDEDLFGVQVCGGYADTMARCAQMVEENCRVSFVDVNFGCPIDLVCSKGAGSACLLKPARMEQVVRSMASVLSCPLTFKMRKGYNDGQDIAHTLVPQAAGWGAAAITLHGRTREQRYSKLADWPYIKRCVDAAAGGVQVVGNGDVFSFEDHYRHLEECPGLATTYIARGALIKPWIFTEIKERRHWDISAGERLDYFKRFCAFGLEHWGSDSRGVETTRRFLLEWMSFTHRYIPVGLLEVLPQCMHWRPPAFVGRSDLETLLASDNAADWVAVSEMLLGPAPPSFVFLPKHKANSYARREGADLAGALPAGAAGGGRPAAAGAAAQDEEEY